MAKYKKVYVKRFLCLYFAFYVDAGFFSIVYKDTTEPYKTHPQIKKTEFYLSKHRFEKWTIWSFDSDKGTQQSRIPARSRTGPGVKMLEFGGNLDEDLSDPCCPLVWSFLLFLPLVIFLRWSRLREQQEDWRKRTYGTGGLIQLASRRGDTASSLISFWTTRLSNYPKSFYLRLNLACRFRYSHSVCEHTVNKHTRIGVWTWPFTPPFPIHLRPVTLLLPNKLKSGVKLLFLLTCSVWKQANVGWHPGDPNRTIKQHSWGTRGGFVFLHNMHNTMWQDNHWA